MASMMGPGDVGIRVTLDDSQGAQGAQRVERAMAELQQTTQQTGATIDRVVAELNRIGTASEGVLQLQRAMKGEADAAAQVAAEHQKHHQQFMEQKKFEQQASAFLARQQQKEVQEAQRYLDEEAKAAQRAGQVAGQAHQHGAKAAHDHNGKLMELQMAYMQLAVVVGGITAAMKAMGEASLDAFKQQQSAFLGLESVSQRTIGSFGQAKDAAQSLVKDGLMTVVEASKAVQAGLASGFSLNETMSLITAFKDSAAFNRQAGLEFGESVVRAMEGVRMGNSVLSDAAGITKNLSQILKEAGYAEQDLQKVSSDAAVRRALYNGILRESALFQGNAAKAADQLAGAEARANAAAFNAKAAFGESLAPAMQTAYSAMTSVLGVAGDLAKENPELARTLFLVVGGAAAVTTAFTGMAMTAIALQAAIGPLGWALIGIGAAAGVFGGYALSLKSNADEAQRTKDRLAELTSQYYRLQNASQDATRSEQERAKAQAELRRVAEQIKEINPDLVSGLTLLNSELAKLNNTLDGAISKWEQFKEKIRNYGAYAFGFGTGYLVTLGKKIYDQFAGDGPPLPDDREDLLREKRALHPVQTPGTGTATTTGGGDDKMSPALAAALEDLQDLQALDHSADNLKRVLTKVRDILSTHGAELARLKKDRDLIRLRDITLPDQIAQAEYQAALQQLDADRTLKDLTPEQFAAGLRDIQKRFTDYLAAHPELQLQLDLKLKGASDEELRAPLERWQKAFQTAERMGAYQGIDGIALKLRGLQDGRSLALTAGDSGAVLDLAAQIRETEQALNQARFDEKFRAIANAREVAFAGAAQSLADMEKQLIDEESKGDKSDPQRIAAIKQRMIDAVRPAIEAQRSALESLLADDKLTADQRAQIQAELNRINQELYDQDVQAHRIASEAKVAQERAAADDRKAAQQEVMDALQQAESDALDAMQARHRAEQDALQRNIDGLQEVLDLLDRQYAAEDRLKRIKEAQAKVDELQRGGAGRMVFKADGTMEWRVIGLEEAKAALDEAKQNDARARAREALQDRIKTLRDELTAMQSAHRQEQEELRRHFAQLKKDMEQAFTELDEAQGAGLDQMKSTLVSKLAEYLGEWQAYAANVKALLEGLGSPTPGTVTTTVDTKVTDYEKGRGGGGSWDDQLPAYASGGYFDGNDPHIAKVGERKEWMVTPPHLPYIADELAALLAPRMRLSLPTPTLPASLASSTSMGALVNQFSGPITMSFPNVTKPQEFIEQLPAALETQGPVNVRGALTRGAARGRIQYPGR